MRRIGSRATGYRHRHCRGRSRSLRLVKTWLAPLAERNIRVFTLGEALSRLGYGMAQVAIPFAVLDQFHSATDLGFVLAAGGVATVSALLLGGTLADHFGPRRAMLAADTLSAAAQTGLGAWILLGHAPLAAFIVLEALVGAGNGVFGPAKTALVPALSEGRYLQEANAMVGVAVSLGAIVGPGAAGLLVAAAGPGWAVVADGASYFASAGLLWTLRLAAIPPRESVNPLQQLRAGWREFSSRTWLWPVVAQGGLLGITAWPAFYVLGPAIAKESFGGPRAWGSIVAAMAVGGLAGSLLAIRLQVRRPLVAIVAAPATWAMTLVALGAGRTAVVVAPVAFLTGAAMWIGSALWDTTLQRHVPAAVLARVSSYDLLTSFALLPVGFALVGPLAAAAGLRATLYAGAAVVMLSVGVLLALPAVRRLR